MRHAMLHKFLVFLRLPASPQPLSCLELQICAIAGMTCQTSDDEYGSEHKTVQAIPWAVASRDSQSSARREGTMETLTKNTRNYCMTSIGHFHLRRRIIVYNSLIPLRINLFSNTNLLPTSLTHKHNISLQFSNHIILQHFSILKFQAFNPFHKIGPKMYPSTLLTSLLTGASLISATPTPKPAARDQYYGVSVAYVVSPGTSPQKVIEPGPIELNKLGVCYGNIAAGDCDVSELAIQNGTASGGLNIIAIECRAYKDKSGVVPGSATFRLGKPALISTNLATIGGILCYVVELD